MSRILVDERCTVKTMVGDGDIDVEGLFFDNQLVVASDQKWDESGDSYSDQSDVYL